MDIGIPRERQPSEFRVGLPPTGAHLLTELGHVVYLERAAGEAAGFSDEDYLAAGAQIVYSGEEVYGRSELMLKIARPTRQELAWLRSGQTIVGFLHLGAAHEAEIRALMDNRISAIGYERIVAPDGGTPVLKPLSQIGGRMAAPLAARLLQNDAGSRGVLLGGVPGVPPAEVVIIGAGVVGENAARAFLGLGAQVTLLDTDLQRLQALECAFNSRPVTMLANPHSIASASAFADVLVGAVRQQADRAPLVLTAATMRRMRPGALFIDLSIDEGGCSETSRPTTHAEPTYVAEGVVHCCIPNLPGAVARTACHAIQSAAWPYIERLIQLGVDGAVAADAGLANAVMLRDGRPEHFHPLPMSSGSEA
ncbi:MAG TPA: alanine dehydrogenase [Anaerolineales bacterium]|jgi:alanine dehydrogenase